MPAISAKTNTKEAMKYKQLNSRHLRHTKGSLVLSIAVVLLMCMCAEPPLAAWGLRQHVSLLEIEQVQDTTHVKCLFHALEGESVQSFYPQLGIHRG